MSNHAHAPLADPALDQLFRSARTRNGWSERELPLERIHALYELLKWGPTASNGTPARFVFVRSAAAKERLRPHLSPGNIDKTMRAPCCVIVAYDTRFYDLLPQLFPGRDMRSGYLNNEPLVREAALRNSSLQGAYLIIAARALGLDCGPMSGFNAATLDVEFFADGRWKSNFLCNIGYGTDEHLYPRNPRLEFETACQVL